MINGLRVVALTPARGGSKAVPYKNLHPLGGKPLLAWPIESARQTPEIDRVIVSTDDPRIADAAKTLGAEVLHRPAELASDTALVADTIRYVWSQLKSEGEVAQVLVLLEATSPFRSAGLISRCLTRLVSEGLDSIATFNGACINPERTWRIDAGAPQPFINGAVPWKPRQQLTPAYQLNGAVYAFFPDRLPPGIPNVLFGKMGAEVVPGESVIDIDTLEDFRIANAILNT
jgi:CMP-N-acetylneuraminic acid synthetase